LNKHSNEQLRTDRDGYTEKGCQKPAIHRSWNLGRPFSRHGKSWKIAKVMESRGKVMENDDNVVEFFLLY